MQQLPHGVRSPGTKQPIGPQGSLLNHLAIEAKLQALSRCMPVSSSWAYRHPWRRVGIGHNNLQGDFASVMPPHLRALLCSGCRQSDLAPDEQCWKGLNTQAVSRVTHAFSLSIVDAKRYSPATPQGSTP